MASSSNNPKLMPSQEELNSLLHYEEETGKLFWRERPESLFASSWAWKVWNTRYANKEAFTSYNAYGYREGRIYDGLYRAHRVIWAMKFGTCDHDIDHVSGDRSDNRLINLRAVTRADNLRNSCIRSDNTSGVTGVRRKNGRWQARISTTNLGSFDTFEEAVAVRKAAEAQRGFHPNHGRPATLKEISNG